MSPVAELTATMRQALAEVEREPGQLADHLPGGSRTVEALMRRGRVEVSGNSDHAWRVYLPEHQHVFERTLHMDGCHWYASSYKCECGVTASSTSERSLTDGYSYVWMDEEASAEKCERCTAIKDGSRPRHSVVIQRPGEET
jgi:hypothetical protein